MPLYHPGTDVGQVQREVHDLERKINAKAEDCEVREVNSKLDSLERAIREIRTGFDGMEYRLQELEANQIKQED